MVVVAIHQSDDHGGVNESARRGTRVGRAARRCLAVQFASQGAPGKGIAVSGQAGTRNTCCRTAWGDSMQTKNSIG